MEYTPAALVAIAESSFPSGVMCCLAKIGRGPGERRRLDESPEESPDSAGQATGEILAGATSGKCHREQTADGGLLAKSDQVRVKRWCKRPPAARVTGPAWQTLAGARPNRKAMEGCSPEPSGRPQRWMFPQRQNPAYRPSLTIGDIDGRASS